MKYASLLALMSIGLFLFGCGGDNASTTTGGGSTSASVYAFQTDATFRPGDLKLEAANFTTLCRDAFSTYSPAVSCTNFYPFLGKSSTNGFKSFISVNTLNANAVVKLVDGTTTIASSLQSLVDNGPNLKGSDTWIGWPEAYWYSGVASDGSAGNNCQDYANDTSSANVNVATNGSSFSWDMRGPVCDYYDDYKYVCLCN
ncbi:hypothetical protein DOM21_02310 [Bacteriovorax stolpii]|uniref:hypothetical protein n=1 Tax=Bacteriovorax stolpii TaxID=960 RepID=UPI00115B034F|nr:hypothetical protein [Bacteriovorax stolpii]QDK40307.1 hypothetical protein DOM21_02310 [Bacteriovorax stolpii]